MLVCSKIAAFANHSRMLVWFLYMNLYEKYANGM